jgi:hypothetical protein
MLDVTQRITCNVFRATSALCSFFLRPPLSARSLSNAEGTSSVVDAGHTGYQVLQTLPTMKGARRMALDLATGKIYTVSVKLGAPPPATAATPHPRPSVLPDSFTVLVTGRD